MFLHSVSFFSPLSVLLESGCEVSAELTVIGAKSDSGRLLEALHLVHLVRSPLLELGEVVTESLLLSAELLVDALSVGAVLLFLLLLQLLESALHGLLLIISDLRERSLLLLLSASQLRQSAVHLTGNRATGRDALSQLLL